MENSSTGFKRARKPNAWLGGVSGGLAYSIGMPLWAARLCVALLVVCFFPLGAVAYGLAWALAPEWDQMPSDFEARVSLPPSSPGSL